VNLGVALVVSVALIIFLLGFGAGARWQYWWAIAAALYVVEMLAG
jgi:hypothetical protein